jgi:hypothetical protein
VDQTKGAPSNDFGILLRDYNAYSGSRGASRVVRAHSDYRVGSNSLLERVPDHACRVSGQQA